MVKPKKRQSEFSSTSLLLNGGILNAGHIGQPWPRTHNRRPCGSGDGVTL
jgi:hypothetical protein